MSSFPPYVLDTIRTRPNVATFILTLLKFYRFVVYCILKWKLGSELYRLLEGDEVLLNVVETKKTKAVTTVLLQVDFQGSGDDFVKVATEEVLRVFSGAFFEKLRCTRETSGFLGFYYYRKCNVTKNEYIKEFKDEDLKSVLGGIINVELPKNNRAMWDVHISKIKNENCYPIVFRFHNTVGDVNTILQLFAKKNPKVKFQQSSIYQSNNDKIKSVFPSDVSRNDLIGTLTGEKHLVWFTEKTPKYLSMIKHIKNKHKTTFTNVLATALSSSLYAYCKKNKFRTPTNIFMVALKQHSSYGKRNYELSRKLSIGFIEVPLVIQPENLVQRLQMVSSYNNESDLNFKQKIVRELKSVPVGILKIYVDTHVLTAVLSNIPGCSTLEIFNGCKVKEFLVLNPNYIKTGISLMLTTYENRLNLAFTFDKSIVPNYEDGEEICKNTLECFNKLYKEF